MNTTTARQRLDEIENYLTPKEWAIRLAGEWRKYPDALACMKALAKLPFDELPVRRPYFAFEEQAGELHPGEEPEDPRARHRLTHELWHEFHVLKLLIRRVNEEMQRKVESICWQAAFQWSALHALILQNACGRTATRAAALLKTQKERETKRERQVVLKELAAFTEAGPGEPPPTRMPSEAAPGGYPSPLVEWRHEFTALLKDFYAHRAAVELIQEEHFDGHPILFLDVEGALTETMRTVESAVATANEYLQSQGHPPDGPAGPDGRTGDDNLAIALDAIKAGASGQWAAAIAENWMSDTREEAVKLDAEKWERWREKCAEEAAG
jgi:hypothetical protein